MKRGRDMKKAFVVLLALVCSLCFVLTGCKPGEQAADLVYVEATDATCYSNGNIEYWYRPDCGKYYADENAQTEITLADTVIAATGVHVFNGDGICAICGYQIPQALYYTLSGDGTYYSVGGVLNYSEIETGVEVEIPGTYKGLPVKEIRDYAFHDITSIESVVIPGGVTSIGDSAFEGCSSLERVSFGENGNLQSIGAYAFYNCTSLEGIIIPDSVTSIGDYAFEGC